MIYIITAIFLWSSLGIVIKMSNLPVQTLIFFSAIISSIITGIITIKRYKYQLISSKLIPFSLLAAVSLLNTFTFFYAYRNTTISNAVLTHYTAPVIVALLSPLFLRERITLRIIFAILVSITGLSIMLGFSVREFILLLRAHDRNTMGIVAGISSGIFYAILVLILRVFAQKIHPVVITFLQNTFVSIFLIPFVSLPEGMGWIRENLWQIMVMGLIHSTIAPLLYVRGMKDVTANRAAITGYLEPLFAIILGIIFVNEALNLNTITGGILIIYGGYLTIKDSS